MTPEQESDERIRKWAEAFNIPLKLPQADRAKALEDALYAALPFVEDAAEDEVYKACRVHQVLKQIHAALGITPPRKT
jgi:hypothetical protein